MILTADQRDFVTGARTAVLATIANDGSARLVPICFVLDGDAIISTLDEKPKRADDPHDLARVRDIVARPDVSLLVHRWDEEWSRLGWVRLYGTARLVEPGDAAHTRAVTALRRRYPQYAVHAIDRRPMLAIAIHRVTAWGDLAP